MATAVGLTLLAATCLYAGGMVLNDVFDLAIDRKERPERPLPSGRISPRAAALVGWILLIAGVAAAAIANHDDVWLPAIAATIAFLVVIYDPVSSLNGVERSADGSLPQPPLCARRLCHSTRD